MRYSSETTCDRRRNRLILNLTRTLKLTIVALAFMTGASLAAAEGDLLDVRDSTTEPVKVIFDTDIGGDIDDVFALALLHVFQDRGVSELLAVTTTNRSPEAPRFVAAINSQFGRPEIPVGIGSVGGRVDDNYLSAITKQTQKFPVPDGFQALDAIQLLRQNLAAAQDKSVVVVQVGFSSNLAALLDSPADAISDLTGDELVAKKVRLLSVMGGGFSLDKSVDSRYYGEICEWNIANDVPAAQKIAREWPSPIVFSGAEVGDRIRMSPVSLKNDYQGRGEILRDAYLAWARTCAPGEGLDHARPTWDLTSVFFVLRPEEGREYFALSDPGRVDFDEKGKTLFTPDAQGTRRVFLIDQGAAIRVREAFVNLCSEP